MQISFGIQIGYWLKSLHKAISSPRSTPAPVLQLRDLLHSAANRAAAARLALSSLLIFVALFSICLCCKQLNFYWLRFECAIKGKTVGAAGQGARERVAAPK